MNFAERLRELQELMKMDQSSDNTYLRRLIEILLLEAAREKEEPVTVEQVDSMIDRAIDDAITPMQNDLESLQAEVADTGREIERSADTLRQEFER